MSNQERNCNTNEQQEWMVNSEEEIAYLFHFPVVWSWHWKSHLIINTVPVGAAVASETDLFHHLWLYEKSQDWRKCTSRGHHMSIFILILIFLICTLAPFRNYAKNNCKSFREKHRSFREREWRMSVQHVSEQVLRDPAGAQSELLLIYIFNHSDWIWDN